MCARVDMGNSFDGKRCKDQAMGGCEHFCACASGREGRACVPSPLARSVADELGSYCLTSLKLYGKAVDFENSQSYSECLKEGKGVAIAGFRVSLTKSSTIAAGYEVKIKARVVRARL